jgi:ATP-binding cassette, subfamily B, bacterial PglK
MGFKNKGRRDMFRESVILRSVRILSRQDQKKVVLVLFIQVIFGFLDLAGVALVGVIGGLAITGVQGVKPGNRIYSFLEFLGIESFPLQTQVTILGVAAAFLLIAKTILSVVFVRKTIFFLSRRSAQISTELISRVLQQSFVKLQSRSMQETLFLVTSGVNAIAMGVLSTSVLIISDTSLLIILSLGLFVVDPIVALSTLLVFSCISYILYRLLQVRAKNLGEESKEVSIQSSEKILEVLNSYREIVVRDRQNYYARLLGGLRFRLADVSAETTFMPNISKYVIEITVVLGSLIIAAVQFILKDAAQAFAVLSVFMVASTRISPAILRLQQGAVSIKTTLGAAIPTLDLIEELSEYPLPDTQIKELDLNHQGFVGGVEVKDVTFTYPQNRDPAISGVSLQVKPGQIVSFVGSSGAGKSTLIDSILGILEPEFGTITIQGLPSRDAIKKWPGAIGYVPQDVLITNGTILENVCLAYPINQIDVADVWRALQIAHLADFVNSLPNGLNTQVGDRGTKISGGQRQRIGIARAMYTNPKLLVLDEATSSLDGVTESIITEAIQALKGDVTILLIAHRLSTVKESDVIHYLSGGKLLASGTFEQVRNSVPEFNLQAESMGL